MATEAFHNLKDKKKKNVLGAISSCLKNMTYDELSVNDIVMAADISRGSFYNYFTDKSDAVKCLIESRVRDYFDMYIESIKESDYKLFDGTRKLYKNIVLKLSDAINVAVMRNLKFFSEFATETVKSNRFKEYYNSITKWFVDNTVEGKNALNSTYNMSIVLDMIIMLILNSIISETTHGATSFSENSEFEKKLAIIENGINYI